MRWLPRTFTAEELLDLQVMKVVFCNNGLEYAVIGDLNKYLTGK